jgi:hypothetical protein
VSESNGHPRTLAIQFGRKRIEYQLRYSKRKTLAIDVHPDLSVVVTAPTGSADAAVVKRVEKRAAWIIQQQRFFETYLPAIPPPGGTSVVNRFDIWDDSTGCGSTRRTWTG